MATNIATKVGGGGVPIVAPESIEIGSAFYTVPAGKLAVVSFFSGKETFRIDGNDIIPAGNTTENVNFNDVCPWGSLTDGTDAYVNDTGHTQYVYGNLTSTGAPGAFYLKWQIENPGAPTDITNFNYGNAGNGGGYYFEGYPLPAGKSLAFTNAFGSCGANTMFVDLDIVDALGASTAGKLSLPAGSTIEGGSYVAEIYSV